MADTQATGSFLDELSKSVYSEDPVKEFDKVVRQGVIKLAEEEYKKLKDMLLLEAKSGKYKVLNGKKVISVTDYDLGIEELKRETIIHLDKYRAKEIGVIWIDSMLSKRLAAKKFRITDDNVMNVTIDSLGEKRTSRQVSSCAHSFFCFPQIEITKPSIFSKLKVNIYYSGYSDLYLKRIRELASNDGIQISVRCYLETEVDDDDWCYFDFEIDANNRLSDKLLKQNPLIDVSRLTASNFYGYNRGKTVKKPAKYIFSLFKNGNIEMVKTFITATAKIN